ncbi:hypothetical protein BC332_30028 [Capsicum chinense]|nr:hypothetical protein BC332_30028 [Capsicum chinense]
MLSLGYRFHPTDEELINYLKNFVLHGVLPPRDFIKVADLFEDLEPWEIMTDSEKTGYFLSRLKRFKNSTKKFSRTVGKGTCKGQNSGNPIEDGLKKNTTIGYKRSLKYKSDNEKDENNDKWLMKEYFLPDEYFRKSNKNYAFVICKIKEKKKNEKKNKGVVNDDVMEEEVDEFIDYVLESIPDNHQVITNGISTVNPASFMKTHNYFYGEKMDEAETVKLRGTSMFTSFGAANGTTSYQQHINQQKSVLNSTMSMNRSFRATNGMNELSVKSLLLKSHDVHHQQSVLLAFTS